MPSAALSASTSTIATAARVNADLDWLAGNRANAAQSYAIFRRLVSLNGLPMQLDYTTSAFDETTGTRLRRNGTMHDPRRRSFVKANSPTIPAGRTGPDAISLPRP